MERFNQIELVVVCPLKRTLQTATELFKEHPVPVIALECCREYPMGLQTCNKRSSRDSLMSKYLKSILMIYKQIMMKCGFIPLKKQSMN